MEPARRVYRLLLHAYPREIRVRDGAGMEEAFMRLLRLDRERAGLAGALRCWSGALWDVARTAAAARWRQMFGTKRKGGGGSMETLGWDLRLAARTLARRPAFTATAVITLALGIGANASMFTVAHGLLLTPLPYEDPGELIRIWDENPALGWSRTDVSPANAWDWRARARTLEDVAVYYDDRLNLVGDDGPPEVVTGVRTTPNLFRLLGTAPVLGRDLAPDEMGEGRSDVVILSHGFWERRFAADPSVLGSALRLDGTGRTVVGILPPDFRFLDQEVDVFLPMSNLPGDAPRDGHYAEVAARLAPGADLDAARAELRDLAAALEEEHPETNEGWTVSVVSLREDLLGDVARRATLVLMAAVGFILLMVCVNVANLLLARAADRRSEMAVRSALGAGRGRLVRQLLTESLALALVGGAAGLLLGAWGYRAMVAVLPPQMPPVFRFGMDGSVLAYVAGITLVSALLFGTVPALRASRFGSELLRSGGQAGGDRSGRRFGGALVVVQTALALVLLVGGGLLMKSIVAMRSQDFGFDPEHVLTVRVAPPSASYQGEEQLRAFWTDVQDRVASLPEVLAVGTTQSHPLMGSNWGHTIRLQSRPGTERSVRTTYASPGLFPALGLRVVEGRALDEGDTPDGPTVAVVNRAFVRQFLGEDADPLSERILGDADGETEVAIVGVIEDMVERAVDDPPEPSWYLPTSQHVTRTRSLVVRTRGEPAEALPALQEAVWAVDPALPLFQVETMEELVDRRVRSFASIAQVMGVFALLSLLLGAVGIYGVTAHAARRRTGEIGVRLAMGADRGDVVRMVLLEGGRRAAAGVALGLVAALGLARLLGGVLVGVSPWDPWIFAGVALVLAGVSFLGLWLPARKAARVDPVRALAAE